MYDGYNTSYSAPIAYVASDVLSGVDMGTTALNGPQDLYVGPDNQVYIVDTKNNRIVILNDKLEYQSEIREYIDTVTTKNEETGVETTEEVVTQLNGPKGVFLGPDGLLYICDTDNHQVVAINSEKKVVKKDIGKDIVAVNKKLEFKPEKIVVDSDLSIYVVDSNVYQGILQYTSDLKFESFYSPNEVEVSAYVRMLNNWKNIFSDEMNEYMENTLPSPYNNIFINHEDFIYTTATGVPVGDELKCLNSLGRNILVTPQTMLGQVAYGDLEYSFKGTEGDTSEFVDIHADENGVITAVDSKRCRIFQYDKECNLICIFGGQGKNKGLFETPVSIEKLGDKYLVLDATTNSVTVFEDTEYVRAVYEALDYYNQGLYEESVDLWQNVLSYNNHYATAYKSIGRAYLQQGRYEEAMEILEKGNDQYFYSMALKEFRKQYTRENMWWMVIVIVAVLVLAVMGIKRLRFWLQSKPFPKKKKKG